MVTILCKGVLQISTSPALRGLPHQPCGILSYWSGEPWLVSVCKARGGEVEKWE